MQTFVLISSKAFLFGLVGRYDLNVNLYAMNIVWHVTASD